MKTTSLFSKRGRAKSATFFFCCFIALNSSFATVGNTDRNFPGETIGSESDTLIIEGVLVSHDGKPLKGKAMKVYIPNSKTTVETYSSEPKKSGIGKQIQGTGMLAVNVEGVKGGGALKLIDGAVSNPGANTDENGHFIFVASAGFIEGESEFIVTVDYIKDISSMITLSYPLVDEEGNPLILKIDGDTKVLNLGKVKTLKE